MAKDADGSTATIDDAALGAEAGETIRTLESGVTVKKSGAPKDAIGIKDAGAAFLETLNDEHPEGAKPKAKPAPARPAPRERPKPEPVREERHPSARRPAEEPEELEETDEEREEREKAERLEEEDRVAAAARRPKPGERPKPKTETAAEKTKRERDEALATETDEEREEREQREADEEEGAPIRVKLRGLEERGEEDLEIEVDDPAIAERIQRAENSGMRRREYETALLAVEDRADEINAVVEALSIDPVGYTLNHMTPKRQVEVLRALLLEHFDEVGEYVDELANDPAGRQAQRVKLRDDRRGQADLLTKSTANQKAAKRVIAATSQLIPDDIADDERTSFLYDAEQDFIREVKAGRPVTPELVPRILARRLKLYGFPAVTEEPARRGTERDSRVNGGRSTNGAARARPLSDRARQVAEDERDRVRRTQDRIRNGSGARRAAARVAQPGAGAGAISEPIVPATADIREAGKALRKAGKLSAGWTTP